MIPPSLIRRIARLARELREVRRKQRTVTVAEARRQFQNVNRKSKQ